MLAQLMTAVLQSEHPRETVALVLDLMLARSRYLVGKALAERYPTEDALMTALTDATLLQQLDRLAVAVEDAQLSGLDQAVSPEDVQQAAWEHYSRALLAIHDFADQLGVSREDLVATLVRGG